MRRSLFALCLALVACTPLADAKTTANLVGDVGDVSGPAIERACVAAYEPLASIADPIERGKKVGEVDVYCHPETGSALRAHSKLAAMHAALVATILAIEAGVPCTDEAGRQTPCDVFAASVRALDAVRAIGQAVREVQK
jgi:hypothetical protein